MAITTGVGPHAAWLSVNGTAFPIEHGSVSQHAKRKSADFSASLPLSFPGAADLAGIADNTATMTVMARGQTSTVFTGEIKRVGVDYIGRTINVYGQDNSSKLHHNKTSEKWQNKLPSDIVQDLIGRVGLSGNVTSSAVMAGKKLEQDFIKLSDNVSFAQVIHKLAELDGARWFVDANGQFHYLPFGSSTGAYSIQINQDTRPISSDCLALRVSRNVEAGKKIEVSCKAWHPKKKQVFAYTATVEGSGGPHSYSYHIPTLEMDHVKKYAQSQAKERARHELTVNATVVGDTAVAAGMALQLTGTEFDQSFEIDAVHHEFGMSGYTTSITARSARAGRTVT
ncbi:hypothetical protein ABIB66_007591 [Bradyrhizobium sp. F1.13.3]